MADLLESLARGLKSAGGTLNPQVYQNNENEYQATVQNQRAQENQVRNMVLQAQMKQHMQQNDPEYQAKVQALRNEQGYRTALENLPQDAPLEEQAKLAMRFGRPEIAAQFVRAREERAAREQQFAATMEQKRVELAARLQEATNNRASREELARIAQEGRADMIRLAASLRQPPQPRQPQVVTNEQGIFQIGPDGQAVPVVGPDGKPLTGKSRTADTRQVVQLSRDLERAGLPEIDSVIANVEKSLTPETAKFITGPGMVLPDRAVSAEAKEARQNMQKFFNITLKNRSGAAVTNQELDRLKKEFAQGFWKTPEQVINGVNAAREIINNHYRSISAGYGPEVLNTYNNNIRDVGGRVVISPKTATPAGANPDYPPPPPGFKAD